MLTATSSQAQRTEAAEEEEEAEEEAESNPSTETQEEGHTSKMNTHENKYAYHKKIKPSK